jgi:conjugal transfer pilus assembly protein TraB
LDNGTLPNGEHSSLKGCFVTAAAYGDASSERGQIRLQRLSCIRKPSGWILDVPVEGTISDMGGSDGIRGHVVMRNNKLIWNAGVAGILSGFGSAMQQSATSQAVSPLGVTNIIKSGKALEYGAYSGANNALGKLADYYIKLADMYHPIVQVHAGSEVNIVFLKGFSLTEGFEVAAATESTSVEKKDGITQDAVPKNLMQTIRDSKMGQEVNVNDNIENGEVQ